MGRIIVAVGLVALSGCGIPVLVVLEEPILGEVGQVPPTFTFSHSPANDVESFAGYELYYKFYTEGTADSAFAADTAAIEGAAPGAVVSTLGSRGFHRIYTDEFLAPPALDITAAERAQLFELTVSFQASPGAGGTAEWNAVSPTAETLLRDPEPFNEAAATLGFSESDIEPDQPDLPAGLDPSPGRLEMAVAIFAYGIDFATGTFAAVTSQAVMTDSPLQMSY